MEAMVRAGVPIDLVVADRPCVGLQKAQALGLTTLLLERIDFTKAFDHTLYSRRLVRELQKQGISKIAMAGWMTLLAAPMFQADAYKGRVLNTHPSLLPQFPGAYAVRNALAAHGQETGCTVHVATIDLDAGPIVAQWPVAILPDDTEASLHERIKQVERVRYPEVVQRWLGGELNVPGLVK
jgi:phosphoribosylglycinamide formyltransferase 1